MTQINELLIELNPWWKQYTPFAFKQRVLYKKIQKFLPLPHILAFTGLRRVGKTTLLRKIIEDKIQAGFDSTAIVYFSFDEWKGEIREVISTYTTIMKKDIAHGSYLLVFDEIQKVSNWEQQIKGIYDSYKNIKILISGSESLFLRTKSKETLAGRMFEFTVDPLSFPEFLLFKEKKLNPLALYEKEAQILLKEFTLTLGFPELVGITEKEIIKKYVKESIIEKIIYRDIPQLTAVKDIAVIEALLNIIMEEPGQMIELADLAQELKISRQTVAQYLLYLEDSFLIKKLYNFSRNRRKVEKKLKKYYPTLISPDLLFKDDNYSQSKVFEWFIVMQTHAEFFWRDSRQHEVDIILNNNKITPIEVKYGKIEEKGVLAFMEKFKCQEGMIISSQKKEEKNIKEKKIIIIPAYQFLLTINE